MEDCVMTPTTWFIRHAESEANAGLSTIDPIHVALTPNGQEQAEKIAQFFPYPPSLIIASAYIRTQQTAYPLCTRFPWVPKEVWPVHEFTFLALDSDRKTTAQDRRPLVEAYWQDSNPYYIDGEGAESFDHFIKRVRGMLNRLMYREEEFIAVFSHEQFIRAVVWLSLVDSLIMCSDMRSFRDFLNAYSMPNGSIVQIQFMKRQKLFPYRRIVTSVLSRVC
jgi:2,3-bisphosphoglycerate-dependent phosphoglycerate mutase